MGRSITGEVPCMVPSDVGHDLEWFQKDPAYHLVGDSSCLLVLTLETNSMFMKRAWYIVRSKGAFEHNNEIEHYIVWCPCGDLSR